MAHAMDTGRIISTIEYNLVTPCYGIYHPDSWMFNPEVERLEYDLEAAGALLDEAGWKIDEERGGWRYRTIKSVPVKFEFTLHVPRESSAGPRIAAIFQRDLKRIGVSLKTQLLEWATFQEQCRQGEFQAAIFAWGTGTDPDLGWNLWHSSQHGKGRNYGGYSNPRVDELYLKARRELDSEKRADQYREIQKLIYDDQPYLFLFNRTTTWAFHKRLRGVTTSPRGVFNFYPSHLDWWVPEGEQLRPPPVR
jgi:peptide/nickel transport system substrate-binding protein